MYVNMYNYSLVVVYIIHNSSMNVHVCVYHEFKYMHVYNMSLQCCNMFCDMH